MAATDDPGLARVAEALRAARAAQHDLHVAVDEARAGGRTWAEVGEVLGISRQAAFKRFGAPRDPRTGESMSRRPVPVAQLVELAERVWAEVDAGDHAAVHARMPAEVATVLTRDVLLDTWAGAVAEAGNLERCAGVRVESSDGESLAEGDAVLGGVVVHAELVCEAGSWTGRVAVDDQQRVVGLYVTPTTTPRADYPF